MCAVERWCANYKCNARGPCLQRADVAAAAMRREVDNARASALRGKQAGDRNNEVTTATVPQHAPRSANSIWAKKANGAAVGGAHGHESFCIVAFVALHALCLREVIKLADNRTCDPQACRHDSCRTQNAQRTAYGTHREGHNRLAAWSMQRAAWSMQRAACNKKPSENVPSSVRLRFARSEFGSYFSACSPSSESDGPKGRGAANSTVLRGRINARALSHSCVPPPPLSYTAGFSRSLRHASGVADFSSEWNARVGRNSADQSQ